MNVPIGPSAPARDAPITFGVSGANLSALMPMHVVLSPSGEVLSLGATLEQILRLGGLPTPTHLSAFCDVLRPRGATSAADLLAYEAPVKLRLRTAAGEKATGQLCRLAGGAGVLINLSLGFEIVNAIRRYKLTSGHFAPTDLAVEMLYLIEAKSAAQEAQRNLNEKLRTAKSAAEQDALTDELTGLANRRAFDAALQTFIDRPEAFALMQLDLDFFKSVNDTHGHGGGDAVLRATADHLRRETRSGDLVARIGGDEFLILVRGSSDANQLKALADRIISLVETPIVYKGMTCEVSCSIGIAQSNRYASPDAEALLRHADIALYASKRAGRCRTTIFEPELERLVFKSSDPRHKT